MPDDARKRKILRYFEACAGLGCGITVRVCEQKRQAGMTDIDTVSFKRQKRYKIILGEMLVRRRGEERAMYR